MRRVLFHPSWLARHALAIGLVLLFARLGWWQWEKGRSSHGTMQNLFYGLEWPVFAFFVIFMWVKMIHEELHPRPPEEEVAIAPAGEVAAVPGQAGSVAPRVPGVPAVPAAPAAVEDEEDDELAAYNRYLASLYERDRRRR